MQAKIATSLREYRHLKQQVLDELVSQETEASIAAALSLEEPPQSSKSLDSQLAERLERAHYNALDTEKLLSTATARKLTEHFSLDRIQQILKLARRLLAQNSDSDSSGEDEDRIPTSGVQGVEEEEPLDHTAHIDQHVSSPNQHSATLNTVDSLL